ncbi:uncharacterized protein LOC114944912 [Nylanderia fulva]|uniref:uncharacterized protein LOC114944912 n=1 Tax=Nylanderia fulva TaxID=613905 RepID=UPI0010FAEE48|nr:uncharacterized protein LOC114944912 [Nylanderia fulva]
MIGTVWAARQARRVAADSSSRGIAQLSRHALRHRRTWIFRCESAKLPSHRGTSKFSRAGSSLWNCSHLLSSSIGSGASQSRPSNQVDWMKILASTVVGDSQPRGSNIFAVSESTDLLVMVDRLIRLVAKAKRSFRGSQRNPRVE